MAAASFLHGGTLCAAVAKSLALRWALNMALDLGFMQVQFETDNLMILNAWKRNTMRISYVASIIWECISISLCFMSFSLLHSVRQGNMVVDFMARLAPSVLDVVWIEEGPLSLSDILDADVSLNSIE